ncbi:MAG: hypothetical protein AAFR96_06035 [Planctomycetota bacterium]
MPARRSRLSPIGGLSRCAAAAVLAAAVASSAAAEPTHEILLTNGNTVKVEILEENGATVRVNLYAGPLAAERTFARSEIITITEISADSTDTAASVDADATPDTRRGTDDNDRPADAVPVYAFELDGELGWDITYTPIKDRMTLAREAGAEYVIIKLDNDRRAFRGVDEELIDDIGTFGDIFAARDIVPALTSEVIADWDEQPTIVIWVERALEGVAFLPMLKKDIYFTSDGRMGGIGNLDDLYGSTGDEVVRDKLESANRAVMEGFAIEGGHDPVISRAMAMKSVALWYRIENGEPVFMEKFDNAPPLGGGWQRLTDTGEDEFQDTDVDIVRLQGNDTLSLDADTAFKIGFSKGTADSLDDLLFELGIEDRAYILNDKDDDGFADDAERVGQVWGRGLTSALRTLQNMERDIAGIRVPDTADGERRQAIVESRTIRILQRCVQLATKYAEVFDPNEAYRVNLELRIQQIENEQRRRRIGGGG